MCFKNESSPSLISNTFTWGVLLILKNKVLSNCKWASSIIILPLIICCFGIVKIVLASLFIDIEVLPNKLLLLKSEIGKFSIGLPLFFKIIFNSKLIAVLLVIYAVSILILLMFIGFNCTKWKLKN